MIKGFLVLERKPEPSNRLQKMAEEGQILGIDSNKEPEEVMGSEPKTLTPWEQHASVISIPRFDYNAPSSLLQRSHSGFLITCAIKREKSATKEAMSILGKYVESFGGGSSESLESFDVNGSIKRRKISTDETGEICASDVESKSKINIKEPDANAKRDSGLSLVKLTKSGLLLLTFIKEQTVYTVDIVSDIFQSSISGDLKSPLWCHRIFPIQATCILNEKDLQATVSKLVFQFVNDKQNKFERPVKFAVGYNRRGMEEVQPKSVKEKSNDTNQPALMKRDECFSVVATAVKEVVSDSLVDLKSPEISIFVELLPLSGVSNGSPVVAVSVLPQHLVNVKPKLCIRPLASDNTSKGQNRGN